MEVLLENSINGRCSSNPCFTRGYHVSPGQFTMFCPIPMQSPDVSCACGTLKKTSTTVFEGKRVAGITYSHRRKDRNVNSHLIRENQQFYLFGGYYLAMPETRSATNVSLVFLVLSRSQTKCS